MFETIYILTPFCFKKNLVKGEDVKTETETCIVKYSNEFNKHPFKSVFFMQAFHEGHILSRIKIT